MFKRAQIPGTKWLSGLSKNVYSGWPGGPRGTMFHYTAGCSVSSTMAALKSRGLSIHFIIDRDGKSYQCAYLEDRAWHCNAANNYYVGIEHVAWPGHCELTDAQLDESARVQAEIVKWWKRHGIEIPIVRSAGPAFNRGMKQHVDGIHTYWNPDGHVDGLYHWTWAKYIARIKLSYSGDDELTDAQTEQLNHTFGYVNGAERYWHGEDRPERKFAYAYAGWMNSALLDTGNAAMNPYRAGKVPGA